MRRQERKREAKAFVGCWWWWWWWRRRRPTIGGGGGGGSGRWSLQYERHLSPKLLIIPVCRPAIVSPAQLPDVAKQRLRCIPAHVATAAGRRREPARRPHRPAGAGPAQRDGAGRTRKQRSTLGCRMRRPRLSGRGRR